MTGPRLSVVVPLHNGRDYIAAALESLVRQTCRDLEIVVVDDGSTDDGGDLVRRFVEEQAAHTPAIIVIEQPNRGVAAARNAGVAAAKADLVGFLDADDRWSPAMADAHLAVMAAEPSLALSCSGFNYIDGAGRPLFEGLSPREGTIPLQQLMAHNIIHTSTVVARREVLQACGGFDATLPGFEDYDLWLKIAARSPRAIHAVPHRLADYRRHEGQFNRDWRPMMAGWQRIAARLERDHSDEWADVGRSAWISVYAYCASLAYNAGETDDTRRLMASAWQRGGVRLLLGRDTSIMTGAAISSFLPRPLQSVMRVAVRSLRRCAYEMRNTGNGRGPIAQ